MNTSILKQLNPWWENPKAIRQDVDLRDLEDLPFVYFHPLVNQVPLNKDAILSLRGPRQIGKSTTLKQIIQSLIQKEHPSKSIFFYPCDDILDFKELMQLLQTYFELARFDLSRKQRLYIFLDEITFVKDWQRGIKALADRGMLRNTTVILTGSNSIDLELSGERLPGRRGEAAQLNYEFWPLDFWGYCQLTQKKKKSTDKKFLDYCLTGGFPKVINEYEVKGYISDVTYNIYLDWILGETHKWQRHEETLFLMLKYLFESLCNPLSLYSIAKRSAMASHETARGYLTMLQRMYVLFSVPRYSVEQKEFLPHKNKKWYFSDPFIVWLLGLKSSRISDNYFNHALLGFRDPEKASQMTQNISAIALRSLSVDIGYYMSPQKREVDFILSKNGEPKSAVEVKWTQKVSRTQYAWFKEAFPNLNFSLLNKSNLSSFLGSQRRLESMEKRWTLKEIEEGADLK